MVTSALSLFEQMHAADSSSSVAAIACAGNYVRRYNVIRKNGQSFFIPCEEFGFPRKEISFVWVTFFRTHEDAKAFFQTVTVVRPLNLRRVG